MISTIKRAGIGLFTSVAFFSLTLAGPSTAADLKENIAIDGRLVTLGDLFENIGEKANVVVFEAPAPGKSKTVSGGDLQRIANKHDIDWQRPDYLKRVSLRRYSDTVPISELSELFLELAIDHGANEDSQIRLYGRNDGLIVPVGVSLRDIEVENFSLTDRKDRFSVTLQVPSGGDVPQKINLRGGIEQVRDIPVFNRTVMPGETIQQSDLAWIKYPTNRLNGRAILSSTELVGMTVRRPARTDKPITSSDIVAPVAVAKGDAVTMFVRTQAMVLTAAGRALENGGVGDTIRILNPKSRQTVDAKIIRTGQVEVLSGPTLALGSR